MLYQALPTIARLALLILCIPLLASGCGGKPPKRSVYEPVDAVEDQEEDESPSEGLKTGEPVEPAELSNLEIPKIVSQSPIDELPEGKLYRTALDRMDIGDLKFAAGIRDQLLQHPVYHPLGGALRGMLQAHHGETQAALDAATELSRIPMMVTESYMVAAEAFRHEGKWGEAIACLTNAVEQNPGHARAHRWLGIIYYDTGAMKLATNHLRSAADIDVQDYSVLRLSGLIHRDYQAYESAVEDYRRALRRKPSPQVEQQIRVELADSLRELRKVDEALAVLGEGKNTAETMVTRAACLESQGKNELALAETKQALELSPSNRQALTICGRLLMSERKFSEALPYLKRAVVEDAADHEARFLLGRCLVQSGDVERGKAEIERSTETKELFLKISELHLKAVEEPRNVQIRMQLGAATEQLGRPRSALGWYRAVLGLEPDNEQAAKALERLTQEVAPKPTK